MPAARLVRPPDVVEKRPKAERQTADAGLPSRFEQAAARAMVRHTAAEDGTLTYLVGLPPDALPAVRARDIDAAWHHARAAATREMWGVTRLFRFRRADGEVTDLALADPDAACWAAAVDAVVGIGTA